MVTLMVSFGRTAIRHGAEHFAHRADNPPGSRWSSPVRIATVRPLAPGFLTVSSHAPLSGSTKHLPESPAGSGQAAPTSCGAPICKTNRLKILEDFGRFWRISNRRQRGAEGRPDLPSPVRPHFRTSDLRCSRCTHNTWVIYAPRRFGRIDPAGTTKLFLLTLSTAQAVYFLHTLYFRFFAAAIAR